jgi:general secretion pathway protein F
LRLSQASMTNRCLRHSLDQVIDSVKEGGSLGEGLHDTHSFPLLATRMIQVGEESGNLKQSLRRVADVYDRDFDMTLKRLLNVLEPVLIVSIGAVVAIIVLAMVSAIQELNSVPF